MKLFYLTNSNLKSMPANAVQTKHMFDAFSNIGCSVKYFVRKSNSNYHDGLIWPSGLILLHILIFKIFNYKKKVIIHSRDRNKLAIVLALLGFKVGIEFHNLKTLNNFECLIIRSLIKKKLLKLFFTSKTLYDEFIIKNPLGSKLPFIKLENATSKNFIEKNLNKDTFNKNLCFAMVSSKRKGKGQEKISNLSMIYPSYKFTIIGPALEGIKNSDNLNLVGKIKNENIFSHLNNADIFLAIIDKDMEVEGGRFEDGDLACPLKIFEYLALAKPIIMSKRKAMTELFSFLPGVWFVHDDLSNFKNIVDEICSLDENKIKNIQLSHKKFISKLSWENRAKKVINVLTEKDI